MPPIRPRLGPLCEDPPFWLAGEWGATAGVGGAVIKIVGAVDIVSDGEVAGDRVGSGVGASECAQRVPLTRSGKLDLQVQLYPCAFDDGTQRVDVGSQFRLPPRQLWRVGVADGANVGLK